MPVAAILQLLAYLHAKATVDADDAADNEEISAQTCARGSCLSCKWDEKEICLLIHNLPCDESINKYTIN